MFTGIDKAGVAGLLEGTGIHAREMVVSDWLSLLPFIGAVFAVASTGAIFMPGAWYQSLEKPSWTPPSWLFAPAWTVLYGMIAVAGWLVWKAGGGAMVLGAWALNLVFNAAWSWLMFGRRQIAVALIDALAMLATIILFIVLAAPVSATASWLFVPYLAWVSFAAFLNFTILRLNPSPQR